MQKMKVILDCDDVLLDCNEEVIRKINQEKGTSHTLMDITSWGVGIPDMSKYWYDPEFVRMQPPAAGAKEFVAKLSEMADVFICTAVPTHCTSARMASILEHFPEIEPGNIIFSKRKDLLSADFMLDDAVHNLTGKDIKYPVLFRRPWNYATTGMVAVSTFDEFITLFDLVRHKIIREAYGKKTVEGRLIALVGPSGSGKTHYSRILLQDSHFLQVKSFTTRRRRYEGEDSYNFVSKAEFLSMKEHGDFFETSVYQNNFYGTTKESIIYIIRSGKIPLLIVDINGALALKNEFGEQAKIVFVKRDKAECIRSVLERNMDLDDTVNRISSIDAEMRMEELCDFTLYNNRMPFNKEAFLSQLEIRGVQ